jgi:hypothetical protein
MRVVVGRIALLLGVLVVAAMAWYGANALFDIGKSADEDDPAEQRGCAAATRAEARAAERAFLKAYGKARWLIGAGISSTDVVHSPTPPIEGEGAVLLVTRMRHAKVPELPDCVEGVPVVYVTGRRLIAS